jgi:hypothetical protein
MTSVPGNSPRNSTQCSHVPTTGMDRVNPEAIRSPVPESRSSGSE